MTVATMARIPLDIVAPATGQVTRGKVVAVMVEDLDRLEAEHERLRTALTEARDELARWGWGDMHYGSHGQDKRVTQALLAIDEALGG